MNLNLASMEELDKLVRNPRAHDFFREIAKKKLAVRERQLFSQKPYSPDDVKEKCNADFCFV